MTRRHNYVVNDDILGAMKYSEKALHYQAIPLLVLVLIACSWPGSGHAQGTINLVAVVGAEVWALPRTAEVIAQNKAIAGVVRQLLDEPEQRLLLRYPEGEWGELWGMELQAWLVSLGVRSDRIILVQDYDDGEAVALSLVLPDAVPEMNADEPNKAVSQELE